MSGLSLETWLPNLNSVSLTVFEQLVFNAQKFWGHVTLATPFFEKFLTGHVRTLPVDVLVKFEVCNFNRF